MTIPTEQSRTYSARTKHNRNQASALLRSTRAATSLLFAAPLSFLLASPLHAAPRMPHIFSDHAVLQRDAPIHVWGWADPGEAVTVHFHVQTEVTQANRYGEWSLWLRPESAGGPYTMSIAGSSSAPAAGAASSSAADQAATSITYSDLLVGDVWVASGQSNMEIPLRGFPGNAVIQNAAQEIAAANLPQVRLLHVANKSSEYPLEDIEAAGAAASGAAWTTCTPATATDFSAIAYLFGRAIQQQQHVPVGLIDSTWGGTPVEAWTSLDALTADASLMPALATWSHFADSQSRVAMVSAEEKREDLAAEQAHQPKPVHPWHPNPGSWQPGALFNGMIAPLTPYSIKGVIWYQGETNSAPERAPLYNKLFSTMIADWRRDWQQGEFPFLYVQISSFDSPGENWGVLRDQQRRTLAVAHTAMAVSLDVGDPANVHPPDKQTVAARLVLAADGTVYDRPLREDAGRSSTPVEYSGPLFRQVVRQGDSIRVLFDHGAGLHTQPTTTARVESKTQGKALEGFEIAGEDHHFYPASATIEAADRSAEPPATGVVVVSSPNVTSPRYVRYAWSNATTANLYNAAGLPTSTFTSE